MRLIAVSRLFALLLLAAFGLGALNAGATAQEPDVLRFVFWGDPAEQAAYERVIAGFMAAQPGIRVEADYTSGQSDYYRKITTDFAANAPPDVFLINYRQFAQYAAQDALTPAAPYLDASTVIDAGEYAAVSMDAFTYRGVQMCMPQNVSSLVVYFNVDLFEANDVPLPRAGWTWDEFIAAAKTLTQDSDGDGQIDQYGVVVDPVMYRMVPFVWSAGGEVVDDLDDPTTLTLDSPAAIAGLEHFISLGVAGHNVVPPEAEVAAEEDADRFMRGGAAMFLQSRREVPSLREIEGFRWDAAPLPVIDRAATVLHADAFCIAAQAANPDAVWSFIEYAIGDAGQTVLAETGRIVPSRLSVAETPVFLEGLPADPVAADAAVPLPPASSQVFLDNIPTIHRLPSISTWPEIEDIFNAEFDRAFYVKIDIPSAVERVIAGSHDAFARAAASGPAP